MLWVLLRYGKIYFMHCMASQASPLFYVIIFFNQFELQSKYSKEKTKKQRSGQLCFLPIFFFIKRSSTYFSSFSPPQDGTVRHKILTFYKSLPISSYNRRTDNWRKFWLQVVFQLLWSEILKKKFKNKTFWWCHLFDKYEGLFMLW